MAMRSEDTLAWMPSPTQDGEWLQARAVRQGEDGSVDLEALQTGDKYSTSSDKLMLVNELPEDGVENMTQLNYLHEPALLDNLRYRFSKDHVYTYTGKICIAVNPFSWKVSKPLYEESLLVQYRGKELGDKPPHVYAIAEDAYQHIVNDRRNQSILVSGESGAGKTESVKVMMQYLAVVSKSGDQNKVAAQVLASNPLLEAFGNAKTSRNNNSSRFGKFIEIQFNRAFKMVGARIHVYLLEKPRVIQQNEGERNYHVFYQLMAGLSDDERKEIHLDVAIDKLALLNQSGCVAIEGVDDHEEMQATRGAMHAIGMEEPEHKHVMRAIASVLLLAQLTFVQDKEDHSGIEDGSVALQQVAELLGSETPEELSNALCTRQLVTRDDVVTVPLNLEQASASRDALTKAIYGKLFSWLVDRCNDKLVDDAKSAAFCGILDIFGFEHFKVNSFEQLCINYANERLQQQFNWDVFKSEQAEYEREGIEWKAIEFVDNQKCLDLIDDKKLMGILHVLDEECALQKGTDETLAQKLRERHGKHPYFDAPKRDQLSFTVKHYAGNVTYLSTGFREKNKDALHPDLSAVMQGSKSPFVRRLFPSEVASEGGQKAKSTSKMTVGMQFMNSLASLMRTINETDVHYVRCIKPNAANKPAIFEMGKSALQLRCAGVLEAVRISRMAYPNRMPHPAFVRRYMVLAPKRWQADHSALLVKAREAAPGDAEIFKGCQQVLGVVVEDASRYQLGKTKVFFRAFLLESLEKRRSSALGLSAKVLQKMMRGLLCQKRYRQKRQAAIRLANAVRRHQAQVRYTRQRTSTISIQAAWRGRRSRKYFRSLRAALRIQTATRAKLARKRVTAMRRDYRATKLQSNARKRQQQAKYHSMRRAAMKLQSFQRMATQRRQYRRELAEKKEEAKLSTQLAKMQAKLEAEIEARRKIEEERDREMDRLRAAAAAGASSVSAGAASVAPAEVVYVARSDPGMGLEKFMALLAGKYALNVDALIKDAQEFAGPAAATELGQISGLGRMGVGAASADETSEMSNMLALVNKDREKLRERLAAETEARKKLESERRELDRKVRLGSATSEVETRKGRSVAEELSRKKDELAQHKQMMQAQALQISNMQSESAAQQKRLSELERKMNEYDDSFYSLEARNVRDRTKMEEMGKAKARAEEERNVYRLMLEQAHERSQRERTDARRDAAGKQEATAQRLRAKKQQVTRLENERQQNDELLAQAQKERTQAEEEKNVYRQQCQDLMVQCQSLMEQLSAAHGGEPVQVPVIKAPSTPMMSPPGQTDRGGGGGSIFERMKNAAAKGIAAAQAQANGNRMDDSPGSF
eukprot:jgi/Chrpa1/17480/Chrysochromulina_OHIO_Genome00007564-RA